MGKNKRMKAEPKNKKIIGNRASEKEKSMKDSDIRKDIDLFISEQLELCSNDNYLSPSETSERIKALAGLASARALLEYLLLLI